MEFFLGILVLNSSALLENFICAEKGR